MSRRMASSPTTDRMATVRPRGRLPANRTDDVLRRLFDVAAVTAHLVSGLDGAAYGVPWVAEFRDPWIGNPLAAPAARAHRRLQARIEQSIVHHAHRIVCVTPSMTLMYQRRYPWR